MSSKTYQAPTPPSPPSTGQSIQEYLKYFPQLAQQEMSYYQPMMEAQRQAQAGAYPEYEQLRKDLMGQVSRGISEDAPEWYMGKASDYMKSILGENIRGGTGVDFYTTGMLEQQKNWNDYYRNMAMSFSGNQPIYSAQPGGASSFTPGQVMSNNMQGYGSYMPAWSNMQGQNFQQSMYNQQLPFMYMQGAGNLISGAGSFMPQNINYRMR